MRILDLLYDRHGISATYADGCLTVFTSPPLYLPGTWEEAVRELPKALETYGYKTEARYVYDLLTRGEVAMRRDEEASLMRGWRPLDDGSDPHA